MQAIHAAQAEAIAPTPVKPGPAGNYLVTLQRPLPDRMAEFMPLWDARNLAIEAGDTAEVDRLSALMAPLQESVWTEDITNVITNLGRNDILDKYFRGSAYTQTMRMGLKGTGTAVAADTQASHASWLEQGLANAPTYTGNRPSITFAAASGQSISHTAQTFAITSSGTVHGCFMNNGGSATKDDTTGTLFSAGDFSGGSKAVANLDTLSVTYTCNG